MYILSSTSSTLCKTVMNSVLYLPSTYMGNFECEHAMENENFPILLYSFCEIENEIAILTMMEC